MTTASTRARGTDEPIRTVLVTGVAGFIASALATALVEAGYNVVGIDNFLTGKVRNIARLKDHERFRFVRGDVNNKDTLYRVFFTHLPDAVYHYAACVGVARTLQNPLTVLDDIKGIENVLQLSRDFTVRRVLFSSSSEVYGEPVELPQVEATTPLNSRLPYAVVKNVGEVFFRTYYREFGLDYTIFRFFNTYGPGQSDDFVVSKFIRQALSGAPITVHGDGQQTRTFCFIDDNVAATVAALHSPRAIDQTFNIGSDVEVTVLELAQAICGITGSKSEIRHLPPLPEGDMTRRWPDVSRMRTELLGGRALVRLEDGLRRTIEYFESLPARAM